MESNIDDMTGEVAGYVMEKLLDADALDVFYTPIYMKKNRPAVKLTVLCTQRKVSELQHIILNETTTIGIRTYKTQRTCMERKIEQVTTPWGTVKVKLSSVDDIQKYAPEYEDCKKVAQRENIPLREVYDIVWSILKKKILS